MKFDNVIRLLGEFGFYQKRLYFLLCLPIITCSIQTMVSVFILGVPDHRCAIPGMDNDTYAVQDTTHGRLVNLSIPYTKEDGVTFYDSCEVYDLVSNSTVHSISGTSANSSSACSKWVFDDTEFDRTFVTQANLVCRKKKYRTHALMAFMAGFTVGSLALGIVADAFGRKKSLMVSMVLHIFPSIAVSFAPNFTTFVILRFITGVSVGGLLGVTFVMGMELVGPSKRMWAGIVIEFFWTFGTLILAGLAFLIRDWQHLQLALSIPTVVFLVYAWILPESPRWLLARGREYEAEQILQEAGRVNKVELPEKLFDKETFESEKCVPVYRIFVSPTLLIRTLIIFVNWMVCSMAFYGLGLSVGNLGGNIYLNFFMSSIAEYIGFASCLLFLNRFGRKACHCGSMMLGGLACLATIFPVLYAGQSSQWITTLLAMIGKLGASAAFATIWVFSAELFPTVLRNSAMGASSLCARVGGMVAPYIADLGDVLEGDVSQVFPLIIFGLATVAAGVLSLCLPETLHRHLPETLDDAKKFTVANKLRKPDEPPGEHLIEQQ
ncbi:hypothetical protein ScPMuIL_011885 [Solemya velum]